MTSTKSLTNSDLIRDGNQKHILNNSNDLTTAPTLCKKARDDTSSTEKLALKHMLLEANEVIEVISIKALQYVDKIKYLQTVLTLSEMTKNFIMLPFYSKEEVIDIKEFLERIVEFSGINISTTIVFCIYFEWIIHNLSFFVNEGTICK